MKIIRRLISFVLAAVFLFSCMPAVFADEDISLLADTGVAVCPYCGSACKVHDRGETLFNVTLLYECENYLDGKGTCSYYRLVTRIKGLGIEYDAKGSGINPSIVDGNAYWNVPADDIDTNPYYNSSNPSELVISKYGTRRFYLPIQCDEHSNYTLSDDSFSYTYSKLADTSASSSSKFSPNWNIASSIGSPVFASNTFIIPVSGTFTLKLNLVCLSGAYSTSSGGTVYSVGSSRTWTGSSYTYFAGTEISGLKLGYITLYTTENPSGGFYGVSLKGRLYLDLVADEYGVPFDYSVANNNYINVENKTILVNDQEINYTDAYYENNVYYVYRDDAKISAYITDDDGNIIGECTYDSDSNSYKIVLFGNYTDDDLSGDSDSSGDDSSSGNSGGSGSSGNWFTDLLQDLLKTLFEGIVDGILAILKAALSILLKLIGSLFGLVPMITKALSYMFPFIPIAVLSVISAGLYLSLILAIVKFIRGFF